MRARIIVWSRLVRLRRRFRAIYTSDELYVVGLLLVFGLLGKWAGLAVTRLASAPVPGCVCPF